MADGKWIRGLTAETPVADAARRVLAVRLQVVRDFLPLALRDAEKEPKHLHQLRVGTRRATASLDIFAPCIPEKACKSAKRVLRDIRRAAGKARDWDVFLATLREKTPRQAAEISPGLDFLTGFALAQRVVSQAHLNEVGKDHPFSFERLLAETVAAVHKPHVPKLRALVDLAGPLLFGLLKEFEQTAAGNMEDFQQLHRVRIIGKRLRYAMEVFADCFAPPFREQLYPNVEAMQEILGNANDSHLACARLDALRAKVRAMLPGEWKRFKPSIEKLLRYHRERLPRERQRFLEWWAQWRQSEGEPAFTALLSAR
jgi:CHAD domain-containing protein